MPFWYHSGMKKHLTLRLPEELHTILVSAAKAQGRSLHGLILRLLEQASMPVYHSEAEAGLRALPTGEEVVASLEARATNTDSGGGMSEPQPNSPKPACTCASAERVKGKHNKWCPAR